MAVSLRRWPRKRGGARDGEEHGGVMRPPSSYDSCGQGTSRAAPASDNRIVVIEVQARASCDSPCHWGPVVLVVKVVCVQACHSNPGVRLLAAAVRANN